MSWTIQKLIQWSTNYLTDKRIETPRLDTELLLAHVLEWQRLQLYTHFDQPLTETELQNFKALFKRRLNREPLAYILGEKEFYSLKFKVTSDTLIPRPETEQLVELGVEFLLQLQNSHQEKVMQVLDLATGSGCVLIALMKEASQKFCQVEGLGVDFSAKALAVAQENAKRHELDSQIHFLKHDLSQTWPEELNGPFALITANLPYVSATEHQNLEPEVRDFEPSSALIPGFKDSMDANNSTGLEAFSWVLPQLTSRLISGGRALLEIGADQGDALRELSQQFCPELHCEVLKDLSGRDRVVRLRK